MPKGFVASGVHCGIKKIKKDLGILKSKGTAKAYAVFTENKFRSAPILVSKMHLKDGFAKAIVVNSGIANALTGKEGIKDAIRMTEIAAYELGIKKEEVLVASTGVIGKRLPMREIEEGIKMAAKNLSEEGLFDFAQAILTTDKVIKIVDDEISIGKVKVKICGICKGSGMIEPKMATMLGFLITDAEVEGKFLYNSLKHAVKESFNRISVDGCMSTNDGVFIMANGFAKNKKITQGKYARIFRESLRKVCQELTLKILKDGEGVTKYFKVVVRGAKNKKEGEKIGRKIINSNLVKTAIYGGDPNIGRIASAIGSVRCNFNPEKVEIRINGKTVVKNNKLLNYINEVGKDFKNDFLEIEVNLNSGKSEISLWGCDLTEKYVEINSKYTT